MGSQLRLGLPFLGAVLILFAGCSTESLGGAPITPQNAEALAAQALGAQDFLEGMTEFAEDFTDVFNSAGAATIPCSSGSLDTTIIDAGPQGVLSAGDFASITFNGCVLSSGLVGVTLNGTFSLSVVETSGGLGGPYSLTVEASFQSLAMVTLGVTVVVNGSFTHAMSTTDGIVLNSLITGDSMSAFAAGNGQAWSGVVENFSLERQYNVNTADYSYDLGMTVSGSAVPGRVTFDTTLPFTGTAGDPSSGIMIVTGAQGASATLVALDDVNVQLLLDLDGNSSIDVTINTTWDALRNL